MATRTERNRKRILEGPLVLGVLRFGAPLVVGMVLHTAFNIIDLFMISRLENGSAALAALGVCDMMTAIATILSNGISTAAVSLIARHLGANHLTGVRRVAWQSMWLVTVLSIVFGAAGIFGSETLVRDVMQTRGEAADIAVPYLQVMLGGCFSIFMLLQLVAILRALGHAKTAASLLVGGNALNIVLNVLLIYGTGPAPDVFAWGAPISEALGIERMGVQGAAWATLIARSVPVVVGVVILLRRRSGPRFHPVYLRPFRAELLALWRLGWPSSAQLVVRVGAILFVLALLNAAYTTDEDQTVLTAFSICLRLETMVLFIGMGWGAAASSFVGTSLGANLPGRAKRAGWVASALNLVMMLGLAFVYVTYANPIMGFFDPDPRVISVGREYLQIVAYSYGLLGVGVVLSQAMAGAGATLQSLVVDTLVLSLVVLPTAWVVVLTLELPRDVLWLVVAGGNVAGALAYAMYYARGRFLVDAAT
ncbi:MAG: MATE family efflux transporter [Myxococcota bacterium]